MGKFPIPGGRGWDVIHTIIDELPDTKVVVPTRHARHQLADRAFQAGAHGYLLKESSVGSVAELVRIAIRTGIIEP